MQPSDFNWHLNDFNGKHTHTHKHIRTAFIQDVINLKFKILLTQTSFGKY